MVQLTNSSGRKCVLHTTHSMNYRPHTNCVHHTCTCLYCGAHLHLPVLRGTPAAACTAGHTCTYLYCRAHLHLPVLRGTPAPACTAGHTCTCLYCRAHPHLPVHRGMIPPDLMHVLVLKAVVDVVHAHGEHTVNNNHFVQRTSSLSV